MCCHFFFSSRRRNSGDGKKTMEFVNEQQYKTHQNFYTVRRQRRRSCVDLPKRSSMVQGMDGSSDDAFCFLYHCCCRNLSTLSKLSSWWKFSQHPSYLTDHIICLDCFFLSNANFFCGAMWILQFHHQFSDHFGLMEKLIA